MIMIITYTNTSLNTAATAATGLIPQGGHITMIKTATSIK